VPYAGGVYVRPAAAENLLELRALKSPKTVLKSRERERERAVNIFI
jgi:hypothetical protein